MKCNVCGCPGRICQQKRTKCSSFYIHLRGNFHESMTVPCFIRRQFNNMVSNAFPVLTPDKEEYVFNLKKRDSKSRICGPGYKEFISNYDMKVGDRIRLDLETLPPHFEIIQECELGITKAEGERNGLELTAAQTPRMNKVVIVRGLGMGVVLVHTLTHTDVKHNGLAIVSALKIARKGWAFLAMSENENHHEAEYHTSSDGRMRFKSGWDVFADEFDLKAGLVVLILFYMKVRGYVKISFDIL